MGFGRCRQEAVNARQRASGVEPAPFIGNRAIDRQNAFAKGFIDGHKPIFNRVGLSVVLRSDSLDAFAYFADHHHAQMQTKSSFFRTSLLHWDRILGLCEPRKLYLYRSESSQIDIPTKVALTVEIETLKRRRS